MKLFSIILFFIILDPSNPKGEVVYIWTNYVDHMEFKIEKDNEYKLIIASCMFEVKCDGRYRALMVIH